MNVDSVYSAECLEIINKCVLNDQSAVIELKINKLGRNGLFRERSFSQKRGFPAGESEFLKKIISLYILK